MQSQHHQHLLCIFSFSLYHQDHSIVDLPCLKASQNCLADIAPGRSLLPMMGGGWGGCRGGFQHKYSNFISLQVEKLRCVLHSFLEFPSRIKSQLPITESYLIMHHLLALSLCLISYYQCFLLSPPKQITYPHILVSNSAYGGNPIVVIVVSVMFDSL